MQTSSRRCIGRLDATHSYVGTPGSSPASRAGAPQARPACDVLHLNASPAPELWIVEPRRDEQPIEAGANTLLAGLLFLGLATALFGVVLRASRGLAYGLVALAFVCDLVAAVVDAPSWLRTVSPFHHLGLVPIRAYPVHDALVMAVAGLAALAAGFAAFRRRDLAAAQLGERARQPQEQTWQQRGRRLGQRASGSR